MYLLDDAAKQRAQYMVGGFGSVAAFSPLYGPISGVPSALLSLVSLPLAFVFLLLGGRKWPHRLVWVSVVSSIIIFLFVLIQASPEQFAFLFDRSQWHAREQHYVEAKLLMLLISFLPQMASLLIVACARDSYKATVGALFVLVILACLASVRVMVELGSDLIRTDHITARNALLSADFSLVSYGTILALGGIASLYFRVGWVLAGILLFMTVLLSRRADAIVLTFCLLAIAFYLWRVRHIRVAAKPLYSVLIAAALIGIFHNGHNVEYFETIPQAFETRATIAAEALSVEDSPPSTSIRTQETTSAFYGYGLGQYQRVSESSFEYPHNIFLEILIELGAIPVFFYLVVILFPLTLATCQALGLKLEYPTMYLAACLVIAVTISFKAGDIGGLGRTAFLSGLTLLAATRRQGSTVWNQSSDPTPRRPLAN